MPDPAVTASGERFARDMRRIRDEHGVSMDDIHDETMISLHIIESFEQDGLFEHPTFNRVYLRSFIRSYANAAGVDPDDALTHLERALEGAYGNELAVQYLGDEPTEPPVIEEPDEAAPPTDTTRPETEEVDPQSPITSSEEDSEEAEEADVSDTIPDENRQGILIGIGVVFVIIIAWVLVDAFQGGGGGNASTASSGAAADSADTTLLEPISADSLAALAEPRVDIGDTMYFTLIAQQRLNPIRIQRDADLRRPYYFNRGQAGVFPARQQIVISEDLENIRLLVNGHEYPGLLEAEPPLVLTRDSVQLFLDSTSTEVLQLVVPADTFPVVGG